MDVPMLMDNEIDSSIEDPENKTIKTYAFCTIEDADLIDNTDPDSEYKEYENTLQAERKEWRTLFFKAFQDMKRSQESIPIIDKSILSTDKRAYLESGPCLQNILRDGLIFRQKFYLFKESKYAEIRDMLDNLEDLCEQRLNLVRANEIADHLAHTKRDAK